MKLLIVRHGISEDRAEFARVSDDDGLRPLTGRGRRRMKRGAAGLASLVPAIDLLATSPLLRAVQTASIVARHVAVGEVEVHEHLVPDQTPAATLEWLRSRARGVKLIALVGHEPHLGRLVGWLACGRDRAPLSLKKGAACLLDLPRAARPGQGVLLWSLAPSQLRRLTD